MISHYLKYNLARSRYKLKRVFSDNTQFDYDNLNQIILYPRFAGVRLKGIKATGKNSLQREFYGIIYFSQYSGADLGYGKLKSGESIVIIMSNNAKTLEILIFETDLIDMNLIFDKFEIGDFDYELNQARMRSKKI